MRYYIRHDKNAKIEEPFTVEALTSGIRAGQIPSDALASSDLGEGRDRLQAWRSCDWFPLAAIAELRGIVPPQPELPPQPRRASVFTVIFFTLLALTLAYGAITERRWFISCLAVLMLGHAIEEIICYARQRKKQCPAA